MYTTTQPQLNRPILFFGAAWWLQIIICEWTDARAPPLMVVSGSHKMRLGMHMWSFGLWLFRGSSHGNNGIFFKT
tara:strand:- start:16425 stop:16649 length:225 start_codon:yes stop_codon:yes gene_type:complete